MQNLRCRIRFQLLDLWFWWWVSVGLNDYRMCGLKLLLSRSFHMHRPHLRTSRFGWKKNILSSNWSFGCRNLQSCLCCQGPIVLDKPIISLSLFTSRKHRFIWPTVYLASAVDLQLLFHVLFPSSQLQTPLPFVPNSYCLVVLPASNSSFAFTQGHGIWQTRGVTMVISGCLVVIAAAAVALLQRRQQQQ